MIDPFIKIRQGITTMLILIGLVGYAQQTLFTQYKFNRLNEADGLTNNVINDIVQDTLGQVWVATNEGLFRYEGFGFQAFIKDKSNATALPNNAITKLHLDHRNNIWLMTDDGVAIYSYQSDIIERFMPEDIQGRIGAMTIDGQGDYYFGEFDGGISKVANGEYTKLNLFHEESGIDFGQYSVFNLECIGNFLWATVSDLGVICYNLHTGEIELFSSYEITGWEKVKYFDLRIDSKNHVWVGTEAGVFSLRYQSNGTRHVDRRLADILPQDDYLATFRDKEDILWIGSRHQGLFKVQIENNDGYQLLNRFTYRDDERGVSSGAISSIFQESSGLLWLGTHNGGVNIFNPKGEVVRMVKKEAFTSSSSLPLSNVWGLCESNNGNIWVGMDGAGLSLLNPFNGQLKNNLIPELESGAVLGVLEDSKERVWVGTYANGIYLYERSFSVEKRKHFTVDNSSLMVNDIRCFYESVKGDIYIGTNQGGMYVYDEKNERLEFIESTNNLDIRSIASTGSGYLYLGTYGRGILKYHIGSHIIESTVWNENEIRSQDVVFDLETDGSYIYAATQHSGVVIYDSKSDEFVQHEALDALSGRSVSAVKMDGDDNLWITTNTGVLMYNEELPELFQFGIEDGFQSGHFNFGSTLFTTNGFMVMGGIYGMNLFYPNELISKKSTSEIVLNQLKISDKVVNPENSEVFPNGKSIFLTDKIVLHHLDNIFSIQFSFPGFTTHKKSDFVYMLEGYESQWQYGAESNLATYRNVPPGHYTFWVKSVNGNTQRSLEVIITPPYWKTWQAYFIYSILVILIIWRLNKFNNSRIVLRQKLTFEQELREKEHNVMQEKLRFYTNFSHELKTPLTLIQGPVNDLLRSAQNKRDQRYLSLIKKNTAIILKFINRMLEFRKIEMNKTTLNVGKHDLKFLAQEEAESFAYLAKERGVKFGFYCENELEAWLDLEKIQIVLNNLLSNALKFTPEGKSVHFGVHENNAEIIIEVKDEGVGIKSHELSEIFSPFYQASNSYGTGGSGIGLALSKSFVELHMGTIDVESSEGDGTKFTIRIPSGKERFEGKDYVRFIDDVKRQTDLIASEDHGHEEIESLQEKENEKMLLVVDDNKDILTYVESLFDQEFKIIKAENGKEAFEFAINNTPDIIISDLMMPGMDGIEFCKKIKSNISTSHVPLIMLTAKDSKQDKIKGYDVGADGYVTKPFASEVLIARVNSLVKNREMLELRYESNDLIDRNASGSSREVEFVLEAERITLQMLEESEFSVPLLCKELGMSQSALYRKIKSLTGVSIQVFIRKIRIKRAAQLLLSEDMTVSEIAFSLEFSDLKYFRKCFKEQFGLSPSEYRANNLATSDNNE
ncbi:two-component regulator propeller domain-containing protein [Marinoscillum sp. MHG1-6]|uniref:hybrid sensor histidine kinase/response regulator transcription factor n=1 Tax=Marinoscillum sp. MHG1-6 TaxID=2959627 RepID=UPI00215762FF|nr:two-component regulator propeller domain-containing protein [Marinoscillum sp. MHG1-6]